jgi:Protein of unknown function (DUF1566)
MKRTPLCQATPYAVILLAVVLLSATSALAGKFPATGQTTAYQARNNGDAVPVDVPDDGTLQRGATLKYKILTDGTVKDLNTGLIWEVKCAAGCGGLHDVDNRYPWSGDGSEDTIWDWLADINAEGGTGYAGHNDWRIPNVRELQSIVDYERCKGCGSNTAAINPMFGPVAANNHWSSTTVAFLPANAWAVNFYTGAVIFTNEKASADSDDFLFVRAVRGGPK